MNINNIKSYFKNVDNFIYLQSYNYQKEDFCVVMKKIKGDKNLLNKLSFELAEKVKPLINNIDIFTSVPKFNKPNNEFNYSKYLAQIISTKLNKPFVEDIFIKVKDTKKLRTLDYNLRKEEISNSFKLNFNDTSKKICIVDDVLASGATLNELTTLLNKNYFKNISIAILVVQDI